MKPQRTGRHVAPISEANATAAGRQNAAQFLRALSDHLPQSYIDARTADLLSLYTDGANVREAAVYARVYLLAPRAEAI